jgi:hypothetical protein
MKEITVKRKKLSQGATRNIFPDGLDFPVAV